jgi:hypothetical protein
LIILEIKIFESGFEAEEGIWVEGGEAVVAEGESEGIHRLEGSSWEDLDVILTQTHVQHCQLSTEHFGWPDLWGNSNHKSVRIDEIEKQELKPPSTDTIHTSLAQSQGSEFCQTGL